MQILLGLRVSDLWPNVVLSAIKYMEVWDSILNQDLSSCVKSAVYHMMRQGQTWWSTQPGIIMLLCHNYKNVDAFW